MEEYMDFTFEDPDFPMGMNVMEPQPPTELHVHGFEELTIIVGGSGQHLYEGTLYPITAGDVYTIKPGMKHGYPETDNLQLVNILFVSAKLGVNFQDLDDIDGYHVLFDLEPKYRSQTGFQSRLRLSPVQMGHLMSMVESLKSEVWSIKPGRRFMALSYFRTIVGYLSRCYSDIPDRNIHSLLTISKAVKYMEKYSGNTISIPKLASITSVSESSLLRAFKKCTGMSPKGYFIQLRIKRACEELRKTDDSISEVAYRIGYSDSNYFSRQFRQRMGATPAEYRKTQRHG